MEDIAKAEFQCHIGATVNKYYQAKIKKKLKGYEKKKEFVNKKVTESKSNKNVNSRKLREQIYNHKYVTGISPSRENSLVLGFEDFYQPSIC